MPIALSQSKAEGKPGQVYHPLTLIDTKIPESLTPTQLHITLTHAALNHRDLFIRQSLYPKTSFGIPLCADGVGIVTRTGTSAEAQKFQDKRVIINPGTGWHSSPDGPEAKDGYKILGGTSVNPLGTAAEEVVVEVSEVEIAPEHLSDAEAAALPLAGLTGWRALVSKAGHQAFQPGRNVLVTGIGGGVALMILQFAVSQTGVNVFVTSGDEGKIVKAVELGAKGGVVYKEKAWEKTLAQMVKEKTGRGEVDAIIDGAGGDIVDKAVRVLKAGGVIVQYGMTVGPKMGWNMGAVLKNVELKGSTMGSRLEFGQMVKYVAEKKMVPVVSKVTKNGLRDLDEIEGLFEDMKAGRQFGKLVIKIQGGEGSKSKL